MTYYIGEEEVNGTIIGDITYPYEFWVKEEVTYQFEPVSRRVDKGSFKNDEEAITWFKANYPKESANGFEIRVFDQSP